MLFCGSSECTISFCWMVDHPVLERQCLHTTGRESLDLSSPTLPLEYISPWTSPILRKWNGWLVVCSVKFEINRQSAYVVFCGLLSVVLFCPCALFARLSFAALVTWLTVLMRVEAFRLNILNQISLFVNETWHLCSSRIMFYTLLLKVLVEDPAKSKINSVEL